jgi:hypothetical protein
VDLKSLPLAPRFARVIARCEPFLISFPGNWPALDLAPFGLEVRDERRYTATTLRSREVVDGLHRLDEVTFGGQDMLMPRWVLFDCGEFPGVVFGFGARARDLPSYLCQAYEVDAGDSFVPLSMWVAIRCAEEGAWFGHNLSSANLLLKGEDALPGLALITKALGVKLTRATKQYGATQWSSASIGLHLRLGEMELLSAYTPAHTHPETFAYRIDVSDHDLVKSMLESWTEPSSPGERIIAADDHDGIVALHRQIEAGARYRLVRVERAARADGAPRLHLRRVT